jgi:hypothetical protein
MAMEGAGTSEVLLSGRKYKDAIQPERPARAVQSPVREAQLHVSMRLNIHAPRSDRIRAPQKSRHTTHKPYTLYR